MLETAPRSEKGHEAAWREAPISEIIVTNTMPPLRFTIMVQKRHQLQAAATSTLRPVSW